MKLWRGIAARLVLAVVLTAGLCTAGSSQTTLHILNGPVPYWVLKGTVPATLDYNFAQGLYYQAGQARGLGSGSLTTTSRPSVKYCSYLSGLYVKVANNTLCVTNQGALIEEARTNDALWSRDMTQASWTLVGDTAALNAVGIDGNANSATTLTATGTAGVCTASCTALQAITLGSTADTYSVFLKRVTGTGTVNITINNLTGVTACTLTTTAFTRCSITATLANPVIGIQMTTVGDVIVADFNQMEPGGFATSPISTTNAAVARAADVVTVTNPLLFGSAYTLFAKGAPQAPMSYGTDQYILSVDTGANANRASLYRNSGGGNSTVLLEASSSVIWNTTISSWAQNALGRLSMGLAPGQHAASFNAGNPVTDATAGALPVPTTIHIGTGAPGNAWWNGYISEIAIFANTAQPAAQLQAFGSR